VVEVVEETADAHSVSFAVPEGAEAEFQFSGPLRLVGGIALAVTLIFGVLPTPLITQVATSAAWVATRAVPHAGR